MSNVERDDGESYFEIRDSLFDIRYSGLDLDGHEHRTVARRLDERAGCTEGRLPLSRLGAHPSKFY